MLHCCLIGFALFGKGRDAKSGQAQPSRTKLPEKSKKVVPKLDKNMPKGEAKAESPRKGVNYITAPLGDNRERFI